MSTAEPPAPATPDRPAWVTYAVGAVIIVAIVVLFIVLSGGGDEKKTASTPATGATVTRAAAVAATQADLAALSTKLNHPVYWVGKRTGETYELTQTSDGSVYIRYLTKGTAIGDARPNFLTVGTYPQNGAFATVTQASKRAGAQVTKLKQGGLAVANQSRPNSWYVAYPSGKQLIEVYSPSAVTAKQLVAAERVVPVKG